MKIGLIAGSGMANALSVEAWEDVETPYGSAVLAETKLADRSVVLLRRHGPKLNVPPHLINYRANISALKQAGVERIISTAAVGSLSSDLPVGTLAVVGDFIDFTKRRESTFFDIPGEVVVHTDFTAPFCPAVSAALEQALSESHCPLSRRVTYLCVDGPRYETPAEIRMFARMGGEIVGMTVCPEVVLARELGICYGTLAIVTNAAAGILPFALSHQEVLTAVAASQTKVLNILERAIEAIPEEKECCLSNP